jgi:hypothetical protein
MPSASIRMEDLFTVPEAGDDANSRSPLSLHIVGAVGAVAIIAPQGSTDLAAGAAAALPDAPAVVEVARAGDLLPFLKVSFCIYDAFHTPQRTTQAFGTTRVCA